MVQPQQAVLYLPQLDTFHYMQENVVCSTILKPWVLSPWVTSYDMQEKTAILFYNHNSKW